MWKGILRTVEKNISADSIFEDLKNINGFDMWSDFKAFKKSARYCDKRFKEISGSSKIIRFPADGRSKIADYIVPKAWDAKSGKIKIIQPESDFSLSYEEVPNSLFMYSNPTKKGGITAEVVLVNGGDKREDYKGLNVKGKIIFTYAYPASVWRFAHEASAIGILSSWKKGIGNGWVNYCFVPDSAKYKMFGFSLNEPEGNKLENLLKEEKKKGKKVFAKVEIDTKLYKGHGETVTSVIKGRLAEEVLVFAHLYEIGALDNASGTSAIIEIARCLNELIKKGVLKKPKRTLRFMLGFECYSLMNYLTKEGKGRVIAGLNIDDVGLPVSEINPVIIKETPDSNPSAVNNLLYEIMKEYMKGKYKFPLITAHKGNGSDDQLPADPYFGAQFPYIIQDPHTVDTWHNSIDRVDKISKDTLKLSAAVSAAYLYFLANAGSKEAVFLAEKSCFETEKKLDAVIQAAKEEILGEKNNNYNKISELLDGIKEKLRYASTIGSGEVKSALKFIDKGDKGAKEKIRGLSWQAAYIWWPKYGELVTFVYKNTAIDKTPGTVYRELSKEELKASVMVPERIIPGIFTLETLPERMKTRNPYGPQYQVTGIPYFWADGKRNLLSIHRLSKLEGKPGSLKETIKAFEFLEKYGYIKINRGKVFEVTPEALKKAVKKCGVKKGDTIFVHSSLSGLGHLKGGAETAIKILKEAVGSSGTVAMPTFSNSFPRNKVQPFDKLKTRSNTGIITETFRRQKGTIRSEHPSHSVSASGKHAAEITEGHGDISPFDINGPFGKLLKYNAKVIFLGCKIYSNSSLHAIEDWHNLPYLGPETTYYFNDGNIKYKTFEKMPNGHRDFYQHTEEYTAKIYRHLFKMGIVKKIKIGRGNVHVFEMKKLADACGEILKKDPNVLLCDDKNCDFCSIYNK